MPVMRRPRIGCGFIALTNSLVRDPNINPFTGLPFKDLLFRDTFITMFQLFAHSINGQITDQALTFTMTNVVSNYIGVLLIIKANGKTVSYEDIPGIFRYNSHKERSSLEWFLNGEIEEVVTTLQLSQMTGSNCGRRVIPSKGKMVRHIRLNQMVHCIGMTMRIWLLEKRNLLSGIMVIMCWLQMKMGWKLQSIINPNICVNLTHIKLGIFPRNIVNSYNCTMIGHSNCSGIIK